MIRGVVYARKSSDDDGGSIAQQREWAGGECPRRGVEVVREFADQSVSGSKGDERPEFIRMIEFCEQQGRAGNPIDVLVCWNQDRFSRMDSWDTVGYLLRLRDAGVTNMLTQAGMIDFHSKEARMLFGFQQEAGAHDYIVRRSADCRRGKKKRAEAGEWASGRAPFGYVRVGKKLAVDPAAADLVRFVFDTYAAGGHGLRTLATLLTDRGVKTPSGLDTWSQPTVRDILRNEVYVGHVVAGKRSRLFLGSVRVKATRGKGTKQDEKQQARCDNAHPAIIPQELFDRVQDLLARNQKETSPNKGYVLTGMLVCGGCGGRMMGRAFNSRTEPHQYVCANYARNTIRSGCHPHTIPERRLLSAVARKLAEAYFNEENLNAIRDEVKRRQQTPPNADRERALAKRVADLDAEIAAGVRKLIRIPDELMDEFQAELTELKGQRNRVADELETLRLAAVPADDLDARVDAIMARANQFQQALASNPAQARTVLRQMVDRVELHFERVPHGTQTRNLFTRGAIYLSEDAVVSDALSDDPTDRAERHHSGPQRRAGVRHLAGDLLLRVRRGANSHRSRSGLGRFVRFCRISLRGKKIVAADEPPAC